jgi:hypothetical protein
LESGAIAYSEVAATASQTRKMIAMLGELMTRNCAKAHCLVSYLLLDDLRSQHSFCANNGAICHLLMMMESVEIPTHS